MEKILKIMRSILTSLLFIVMIFGVTVQLLFTAVKTNNVNTKDLINKETIIEKTVNDQIVDEELKTILNDYFDDYIDYILYKRSYPSIQNIDFSKIPEERQTHAKKTINDFKGKIDLNYKTVITIRKINNTITNGSIYLIVNISIILLFIIGCLLKTNFKKGMKLFIKAVFISGALIFITTFITELNLTNIVEKPLYYYVKSILEEGLLHKLYILSIIYILTSLVSYALIALYDKFLKFKLPVDK